MGTETKERDEALRHAEAFVETTTSRRPEAAAQLDTEEKRRRFAETCAELERGGELIWENGSYTPTPKMMARMVARVATEAVERKVMQDFENGQLDELLKTGFGGIEVSLSYVTVEGDLRSLLGGLMMDLMDDGGGSANIFVVAPNGETEHQH